MSDSFVTPWTVAHQAPLCMRFLRQEYSNGLPFPSPRDIPNPGIKPMPPALQADSLPPEPQEIVSTNRFFHLNIYNGTPLQHSCLENPMDGGAWWAAVHGVAKSRIGLSDFTFTFPFHALEKEMATHSSVLAWRIPGTGEPGGLPSMGLHRVGHS